MLFGFRFRFVPRITDVLLLDLVALSQIWQNYDPSVDSNSRGKVTNAIAPVSGL